VWLNGGCQKLRTDVLGSDIEFPKKEEMKVVHVSPGEIMNRWTQHEKTSVSRH